MIAGKQRAMLDAFVTQLHCLLCFVEGFAIDVPAYSLGIYDNFTIPNGDQLDASCNQDYTLAWHAKAAVMVTTLNDEIADGNLCPGGRDKFEVISSSSAFFSQGSQVNRCALNTNSILI